jgi:hypothetical protein
LAVLLLAAGAAAREDPAHARIREIASQRAEEIDAREAGVDALVPDLELTAVDGGALRLSECMGAAATLIAVRLAGCEVADDYGPLLVRLEREYADRGVAFLYVHAGPAPGAPEDEAAPRAVIGHTAIDEDGVLGKALGVEASGLVFVLDAAGTLRYRGAPDDRWASGERAVEVDRDFVREALDAVLAGRQVMTPATRAVGTPLGIERVAPPPPENVTFHRDVARIFQASCVECHHAGGAAPFGLEDYATAYDRRRMIRQVVEQGVMPPWYATEERGTWRMDRRLADGEREAILRWVDAGAPEGDPAEAPVELVWTDDWAIGEPDLIFQLAETQRIGAEDVLPNLYVQADREVTEDLWIERLQVLPTDPRVVHHASVFYVKPSGVDEEDEANADGDAPRFKERRLLWGYAPGRSSGIFDAGTARFLPKGSRITFEMHYTAIGTATTDRTRIGLVLAKDEPRLVAEPYAMLYKGIDIPPGEEREFVLEHELTHSVRLRSLTPHMHYRGVSFSADLIHPDGREQHLIDIPVWDFDWQHTYVFADGPYAAKGSRVRMAGRFDNSPANIENPDPNAHVRFGTQSKDEMLMLGIEWERPREHAE